MLVGRDGEQLAVDSRCHRRPAPWDGSRILDEAARRNAKQRHAAYRLLRPKILPNSLPTPVTSTAISVTGLSHPRLSSHSAFESDLLPVMLRGSRFLCGRSGNSFHGITLPPRGVGLRRRRYGHASWKIYLFHQLDWLCGHLTNHQIPNSPPPRTARLTRITRTSRMTMPVTRPTSPTKARRMPWTITGTAGRER